MSRQTVELRLKNWPCVISCPSGGVEKGGARGVIVIVAGIGLGDSSSNPGRDWLYFT